MALLTDEEHQRRTRKIEHRLSLVEGKQDLTLVKLDTLLARPNSRKEKTSTGLTDPESMPWAKMVCGILILRYVEAGGDLKTAIGAVLKLMLGS